MNFKATPYKMIPVFALLLVLWSACSRDYIFEGNVEIPNKQWTYDNRAHFAFDIEDTSLYYNVHLNIRHTNEYRFRNMYILVYTTFPSGKTLESRVNLPLADDDGRWYGSGIGDIRSNQIMIQQHAIFPEKGTYKFEIEQNMRNDPLPEIMDIGLWVEKSA